MFLEVAHTLEGWGEFYVILGAAAGALIAADHSEDEEPTLSD